MGQAFTVNGDLFKFKNVLLKENTTGLSNGFIEYSTNGVNFHGPDQDFFAATYTGTLANRKFIDADEYDGVHTAHFLDGDLLVNPTAAESQIYRMYDAAFGRVAEIDGFKYWVNQLAKGQSLSSVAQEFTASPEFTSRYGNVDNGQFVTKIYTNVLGRAPDAAGYNFYLGQLNGGASKGSILASISESAEHINSLQIKYPSGVEFVAKGQGAAIVEMYDTFLGRLPDKAGLQGWIHATDVGTSLQQIADGFAQSVEFKAKYDGTTDYSFVQSIYNNTLHRNGEASGVAYWVDYLAHGHSRAEVALGFATSPEHAFQMQPHLNHGFDFI